MSNYKRRKPKYQGKIYRGGVDGPNCSYCASNWYYASSVKNNAITWEMKADGTDNSSWRFWNYD